jgi:dipeptidyl aminopeptidase/acylaminoacyl peptidase
MHRVPSVFVRLPALALLALLTVLIGVPAPAPAEDVPLSQEKYLTPPKEIADAVLATRNENRTLTNISPDGKKFLITKTDGLPPLARMARPAVHLAEMTFDPTACREHGLYTRSADGFDLFFYADKRTVSVQVPDGARVSNPVWSPDGSKLAFFAHDENSTHICIADTDTGFSRKLTATPVLATLVTTFQWTQDGKQIEAVLCPDDGKREAPKPSPVALEPKVRVTRGGTNPSRTYRYLLESPYDAKLLEYLITGQLALIDVRDGKVTKVGCPNMIRSVAMSPGGEQFRVTTVKKPFSYFVPFTNFGTLEGVWNADGKSLFTLAERNLRDTDVQAPDPVVVAGRGAGGRGGRAGGTGQPATTPTPQPDPAVKQPDPVQPPQPGPDPDPNVNPDNQPRRGPPADPNGKRDIGWRPDGAGLSFLQLEPEKKDSKEPRKDRVLQWLPPFGNDDVKVVYETPDHITRVQYSDDCKMLFLTQTVNNQLQIMAIDVADPKTTYPIYKSGAGAGPNADPPPSEVDDEEQQPGRGPGGRGGVGFAGGTNLLTRSGRGEIAVVRVSTAGDVYLSGSGRGAGGGAGGRAGGAQGEGEGQFPKPYIDKVNIKTGKKTRIFEGKGEMIESVDAVDGNDVKLVFTTRQKKDVVPDSYVTDLQSGQSSKLTNNVDHSPWVHKLQVQRFQVTRADGFKFWVKVTTPPKVEGKPEGKLPALFWIYPREYADQAAYNATANRNAAGANRFNTPGPRDMTMLTLLGYAVVEPDVPIVGPQGKMNDNYVPDLRNSLWTAIDELDKKGIIDRDRLAVGGHSYGAFSTANALAHTPFFKAGIAGDGNYNRTLTSMTFQSERRLLWEARETYLEMSPLLWANRVNGALLMYHGMEDANVGTNPVNAEHLFMALDGLGKPAALYMYPYEGHGPIAKETTLDMWARWVMWLDTYVKNPKKDKK